ncbi:MAG: LicD family protein [Clostridiales bacterium]|nr:LicD family protein [Clostridiales bacterium]
MKEITQLEELKQIELEIMKKIHKFCVDNNITYFLSYGTLIGAIRHQGFIPWDDDIDIEMFREDYNKFCALFPNVESELGLELVNHKTKRYLGRPMSKVIDIRTELIELGFSGDDKLGVFIDIWPIDGVRKNKYRQLFFTIRYGFLKKLLYANISIPPDKQNLNAFIKQCLKPFSRWPSNKKKVEIMDKIASNIDINESDEVACYAVSSKIIYKKDDYYSAVLVHFEDADFFAPIGYDKILRKYYGNYMELPPVDEQVPHHICGIYWK